MKNKVEGAFPTNNSTEINTKVNYIPADYTILAPQMSPIHFDMLEMAFRSEGVNLVVLKNDDKQSVNIGLKYVNNDACYPALIVVGQFMEALTSGKYNPDKTAVVMTQTCGGCRASNYIAFIKSALKRAGLEQVPVISLNANGLESDAKLKLSFSIINKLLQALIYGDLFMRVLYKTRPYEIVANSANELHRKLEQQCMKSLSKKGLGIREFTNNIKHIVQDFDSLALNEEKKAKVGIVGEILVKFQPTANNNLVDLLEAENAEAVMPDMLDFFLYGLFNANFKTKYFGKSIKEKIVGNVALAIANWYRKPLIQNLKKSKRFSPPVHISELARMAEPYVSIGNQTGEGWFLTGEMLELIASGTANIVCAQPFGCLPNHVVGKGVIKAIREQNPCSNIVAIDYDPGASEVNQLNRIKLMLSAAKENLGKEDSKSSELHLSEDYKKTSERLFLREDQAIKSKLSINPDYKSASRH